MINNTWECPQCHSWINGSESHLCIFPVGTFPRGPSNEQTLLTELGEARRQLADFEQGWEDVILDLKATVAERGHLQAFKDFVHVYLDQHGVPHHPPGPHGTEGCRIGDRLRWLMAERDALAVTAERYRLALLRLGSGVFVQQFRSDMPTEDWVRRIVADVLLCDVADLDRTLKETAP